jgi:hypothetical protein
MGAQDIHFESSARAAGVDALKRAGWTALAAAVVFGCSAGGSSNEAERGNPGGGGSGGLILDGDAGQDSLTGLGGLGQDSAQQPVWQYRDRSFKDPELPDDVNDRFGGPVTEGGEIVYPLQASLHPMNLDQITLQWRREPAASVFRIDVSDGDQTYHFYVPCRTPAQDRTECTYELPAPEWLDLGRRYAGQELTLSVHGSSGDAVQSSPEIRFSFSPEAVLGGFYYWSTTGRSIKRASFGAKKAVPFISPTSAQTDFSCVACHSVSRDGKTIAFAVTEDTTAGDSAKGVQAAPTDTPDAPFFRPTRGISPPGAYYPRVAGRMEAQDHFGDNVALNPDGSVMFVNGAIFNEPPHEKYAELLDTKTGERIGEPYPVFDPLFEGMLPIHPEWSPDGSEIAVTLAERHGGCQWTFFSCKSRIAVIPYDAATRTLGKPRPVTAPQAGLFDFYPTWSPDGAFLAFVSAPMPPEKPEGATDVHVGSSSGNLRGVVRLVRASGGPHVCPGPDCFELPRGTSYTLEQALGSEPVAASTWPKFTPFAQREDDGLLFLSFTTRIPYGFLGAHASAGAGHATQIWMFAIDTNKLGSEDASYAPVWLPYQDLDDGSLTPYWTEVLPCSTDPEGGCRGCVGGERCTVDLASNSCECRADVK